jgi:hypothetical protein
MRYRAQFGVRASLLAGPTVLAFFAGGYFGTPRAWAGVLAWLTVLGAAATHARGRTILARSTTATIAISGLAGLAAWTLLSIIWAPIAGSAQAAGQIAMLYLGALLAAWLVLSYRPSAALVEPVLAVGATVVIGYGLSERLLPGLLTFARSISADGRLEQPLTYWNAMGELAAIGLILAARLAGDGDRPAWMRGAAAAAAAPLGMGLYISFSRGALFAAVAGLITLVVLVPERAQLRALSVAVGAAVLAAVAAAPFHGVTNLGGDLHTRERQGAIDLVLLLGIMAAAPIVLQLLATRRTAGAPRARVALPRHSGRIAVVLICAGLALAIVAGAHERSGVPLSGGVARFGTLQSNRYDYWDVALKAFAHDPLIGVGAGGWAVWWLRDRPYADGATDAHSLELQTLAELGLVGLALLAAFLAGIGLVARDALRRAPAAAAGPIAGCVVWLAHSPLDWDWQMPAVTLVAIILAGALLALATRTDPPLTNAATPSRN